MTRPTVLISMESAEYHFRYWEKTKDVVDQFIDIMLNYRQSGHPGGSRSKVHALIGLLLSGRFRWDIRHPEAPLADRFVLGAGHTVPLVYAILAVFHEALRRKYRETGDSRYLVPRLEEHALFPEDLAGLRRQGGLSGHAEMAGKTLFLKWNTGPSGHGFPAAVGQALALKRAGVGDVKVCVLEGEGGLTPGASHEAKNSAWGLGLDNLFFLLDWNDYGIDDRPASSVMYGSPSEWFKPYGWEVFGSENGSDWETLVRPMLEMFDVPANGVPRALWFRTRKGREYLVYDNKSHGAAHPMNSDLFWETKRPFEEKYGVRFVGHGEPAPSNSDDVREQCLANLRIAADVLGNDQDLLDYLAERLVAIAETVPQPSQATKLLGRNSESNPATDPAITDFRSYPAELFAKPGTKVANRKAFGTFGAWVNAYTAKKYGHPLVLACSADLAESTNIAGFGHPWGDFPGYGWYDRDNNPEGVLLPQEITEFANAGITAALATVNFAENPFDEFRGFYGACSTYGSFSYLKYGEMRLFSQLAQDCETRVGKVIWVAGHSGPETAEDARTHFGIFSPTVTQLFPDGQVINLYPWEHNEVPVMLGAALATDVPLIALHLTRPPIEIPDREALGMDSHFEAARGAYIIRDYDPESPRMGTIIVQGTSTTANIVTILPELAARQLNIKVVAAVSPELFRRQDRKWQDRVLSSEDWAVSTVVSNMSRRAMSDWLFSRKSAEYAMTPDFDDRWRTGGSVEEVIREAHLSPEYLLEGIERFARDWNG